GQPSNTRKGGASRGHERRVDGKDEDARQQAAPGGDHERGGGPPEVVEQPRRGAVVFMVVEHDEPLAAVEKGAELRDERPALAGRPVPESEHLGKRPEVPRADTEPIEPTREARREAMAEGAREDRLAAPACADQREPRGPGVVDRAHEGRELRGAAL